MEQVLYSGSDVSIYDRRDYLWNYFVNKALVNEYADNLGLNVGPEELMELQFGSNLSPIIQQRFSNPQTGQVDRQTLNEFRQAINNNQLQPQQRQYWQYQEREIMQNRTQTKFVNLISKSMYTPTWLAEREAQMQSIQAGFSYVKVPFAEVSNEDANVTDQDLQNFLSENKERFYRNEESRIISYASMRVQPTASDSSNLKSELSQNLVDFAKAENDSLFIDFNQGFLSPTYQEAEALPEEIQDIVFDMKAGDTYGPYMSQGTYQAIKVLGFENIPDSVEARHIFRQINPNAPASVATERALLDSLKRQIESGAAAFDSLATNYGQDGSAAKGGDLGYFESGAMLPTFENKTFYGLELGELGVFQSQAGLHLVEVTDKKYDNEKRGVKLGYLVSPIIPSEEKRNVEELKAAAQSRPDLQFRTSAPLGDNAYQIEGITSKDAARSIVRFVYDDKTTVGKVSPDVFIVEAQEQFYNAEYIIAGLGSIIPAGSPKLEDVRSVVRPEVLQVKKGEVLRDAMKGKTLSAIAQQYDTPVDTVEAVGLNATRIPNLGEEPAVVAALQGLNQGELSNPIIGNNGVYMIQLSSKTEMPAMGNISQIKSSKSLQARQRARAELLNAMQEGAEIIDDRAKFY